MATCKRCDGMRFEKLVEVPPWGTPTLIDGTGNPHISYGAIGDFHSIPCPDCKGTGEVSDEPEGPADSKTNEEGE